ncbi:MAG: GTP pyrophosphokinase family protein [Oscillospiraceae bacterium]|nr:GTP pyrophosphokinase family protein [Oscillospiraceae bacterium]
MDELDERVELIPLGEARALAATEFAKQLLETAVDYKELRMMYACAIKEVQTKFEVLETEFKVRYQRNPISSIQTRLKSSSSIIEKMIRKGIPFSMENLEAQIHDLAGIRVICSYMDDIYALADALTSQDDITLVEQKDYIRHPKPNGYRSLHLIVSVPVFFSRQKRQIKVEVQIRTIAMDFWASLEHQMKYKREIPDQQHIVAQLKSCAEDIARVDMEMMNIRRRLEASADEPSEDDLLIARLKKLDTPIL